MNEQVDIISISWTCPKDPGPDQLEDLRTKINEASQKSLVFCATGDNGPNAEKSYPAGFPNAFGVSSCALNGTPPAYAEPQNAQFTIPAEGIEVQLPPHLKDLGNGSTGGSSAATAVAAGLASLILVCARFAYHPSTEPATSPGEKRRSAFFALSSSAPGAYKEPLMPRKIDVVEAMVAKFRGQHHMENTFKYMCQGTAWVQPWNVFPTTIAKMDTDTAKTEIRNFLEKPHSIRH